MGEKTTYGYRSGEGGIELQIDGTEKAAKLKEVSFDTTTSSRRPEPYTDDGDDENGSDEKTEPAAENVNVKCQNCYEMMVELKDYWKCPDCDRRFDPES